MIARASQLFLPTLRDDPADAEAVVAQAARARRLHPPGQRGPLDVPAARLARPPEGRADHPRGDGRDRRAGDADAGARRPPSSGRRRGRVRASRSSSSSRTATARDYVLPLTHEETVTFHARELQRYRQLPQLWYHFQTKDRDEPRPRGGLLRVREFIMKDAYSFDRDEAGLDESFERNREAYKRIFERCGLETYDVQAESGMMGGSESVRLPRARPGPARTRSSRARTATTRPTSRSRRAIPRAPDVPRAARARRRRSRRRTPRRSRRSRRCSRSTRRRPRRRCRVTTTDGTVVLALVRGDDRLEEAKLLAALGADVAPLHRGRDPRRRSAPTAARSARSASRAR